MRSPGLRAGVTGHGGDKCELHAEHLMNWAISGTHPPLVGLTTCGKVSFIFRVYKAEGSLELR